MSETVISGSLEIWRRNAHGAEKGTKEEANQLIEFEIEEVTRTETMIREEEARMRQRKDEEGDVDHEIEPIMEGDQEEIDDLLSDREDKEDTAETQELESRMQMIQMMREPGEARVERHEESQRGDANQEHRENGRYRKIG
jgi:hypothetical protein